MVEKELSTEKKHYSTPELRELGTVTDLTQVGFTRLGDDCKGGSVYADPQSPECTT